MVAERYGIPRVFADHRVLLESGQVDAVVASQPYRHHAAIVPDILAARVHLFTEKPLCLGVATGERLVRASQDAGTVYMVGYHKRSDPAVEAALQVVREWRRTGACGALRLVRITMPPGDWIAGAPAALRTEEPYPELALEPLPKDFDEESGKAYDAFVNYYIHQVNALRLFFGEPYVVTHAEPSGALLVAQSETGACGTIEMTPYATSAGWDESIFVGFEKGYVAMDLPAPLASQRAGRLRIRQRNADGRESVTEPVLPPVAAMRRQAENFIAAVRGERPATCGPEEALADLRIARDYIRLRAEG
jgi:predicted dehydrogenase